MKVLVPDVLQSYTGGREVEAMGTTVDAVLFDLDRQFPGLRFRIVNELDQLRPHIRLFVNRTLARTLTTPLDDRDELLIVQALSGG